MERLKKERAAERQRKTEEKERAEKDKTHRLKLKWTKKVLQYSSDSSSSSFKIFDFVVESERNEEVSEENELNKTEWPVWLSVQRVVNENVIFLYKGKYFPQKILRINKTKPPFHPWKCFGCYRSAMWCTTSGRLYSPVLMSPPIKQS